MIIGTYCTLDVNPCRKRKQNGIHFIIVLMKARIKTKQKGSLSCVSKEGPLSKKWGITDALGQQP